ncbi:MAG: competence/damage-inducible protein A [Tepidisphaeraceae bacterium]|jgi:nicotinamide-nucleotide amidase
MKAIVVSIGDELVLGQTVDTNSAWLSQRLAGIGVDVTGHVTVADDQQAIERAMQDAASRCDALLVSGGLGPTADDLTRQALAAVMQAPLELNQAWLAGMEVFFARLGRVMAGSNRIQAMIPRGAEMLWNTCGTAAGMAVWLGRCRAFVMPGVPREMKAMFDQSVRKELALAAGGSVILSRTLHTFGVGESNVGELLGDLMNRGRNPSVGTTVSGGIVSVRINARFPGDDEARRQIEATETLCRQRLGTLVYGADEQTLPQAVLALLEERSIASGRSVSVTTAESCTGGLIARYITDVPGSSAFFRQGWIVYSDEAKTQLVGVPPAVLREHGAVSEPVVQCMATNALLMSEADFALAVSGIAGPDGGTAEKPVGTVWLALAGDGAAGVSSRHFVFPGDREMVRDRAAKMALTLLRYRLLGAQVPF